MEKISSSDLGWMAAVIDMKGHVITKNNKTRNTPQVVLSVDTKDERIAKRLSAFTGTKPEAHGLSSMSETLRRGCTEHCPEAHIHMSDRDLPDSTKWTVTGLSMGIVLWNLRKYMSTYPEYAKFMGMAFDNSVLEGRGSGQVRASVKRLRDLGWRIPRKISVRIEENETAKETR